MQCLMGFICTGALIQIRTGDLILTKDALYAEITAAAVLNDQIRIEDADVS
jgi:hypothetical protein